MTTSQVLSVRQRRLGSIDNLGILPRCIAACGSSRLVTSEQLYSDLALLLYQWTIISDAPNIVLEYFPKVYAEQVVLLYQLFELNHCSRPFTEVADPA